MASEEEWEPPESEHSYVEVVGRAVFGQQKRPLQRGLAPVSYRSKWTRCLKQLILQHPPAVSAL